MQWEEKVNNNIEMRNMNMIEHDNIIYIRNMDI